MTRYFFHIRNGAGLIEDEEGRELPDLETVRKEALKGVRSIISDEVLQGFVDLAGCVEVVTEGGQPVLLLRFAEAVDVRT